MTVRISSIAFASVACAALVSGNLFAQPAADPNSAPNAYHVDEGWAKLQQGRRWGAAVGVDIDRDALRRRPPTQVVTGQVAHPNGHAAQAAQDLGGDARLLPACDGRHDEGL